MKGQILDYSVQQNSGVISSDDGSRFNFVGSEWKGNVNPSTGMKVDFDVADGKAVAVYQAIGSTTSSTSERSKDKVAAGLLAIFLGGLGIHKFYLGYTGPGLVFLLINTVGLILCLFLLFIPNIILGIIALIEGIIYLTKTDEEFQKQYVENRRSWF